MLTPQGDGEICRAQFSSHDWKEFEKTLGLTSLERLSP
ncbi:hypothetical protein J2129_002470 [Methanofollis sp. W23]|nr:hypothetical protein [Methanofollis sp. W23]